MGPHESTAHVHERTMERTTNAPLSALAGRSGSKGRSRARLNASGLVIVDALSAQLDLLLLLLLGAPSARRAAHAVAIAAVGSIADRARPPPPPPPPVRRAADDSVG